MHKGESLRSEMEAIFECWGEAERMATIIQRTLDEAIDGRPLWSAGVLGPRAGFGSIGHWNV